MYIQEISIEIKTRADRNEIIDKFDSLLASFGGSGQTLGKIESQYIKDNKIVCLPHTLEKKSLDKKFNSFYVNERKKTVEELRGAKLAIRTIGKSHEAYKGPCSCKKSAFYILFTNYLSIDSPLTCGTCNKSVPLYRLPVYYDHGYMPILSWQTNYISCDSLQMNCEVGERWALNQMQEPTSQLSRQGLTICRKIEELTSIPTFYYLHNYRKAKGNQLARPCRVCKKKWNLKTALHGYYEFKCDRCRIVSVVSPNM